MPLAHPVAEVDVLERDVHRRSSAAAASLVDPRGNPEAERRNLRRCAELLDQAVESGQQRLLRGRRSAGRSSRASIAPSRVTTAAEDLRPADVDADDPERLHARWLPYAAGWRRPAERSRIASTAAGASRGGCRRSSAEKSPPPRGPERARRQAELPRAGPKAARRPQPIRWGPRARDRDRPHRRLLRRPGASLGYLTFRSGVSAANKRLPRRRQNALAPDKGALLIDTRPRSCCSAPTTRRRLARRRSHTPTRSRSCAPTPSTTGSTTSRSRATSASRSRATARREDQRPPSRSAGRASRHARSRPTRRSRSTTSSSSNFAEFKDLIDEIGGIDVDVTAPILSKFDCPYGSAARCARWPGWRFAKGQAAPGRPPRADLLARAQEPARPGRQRHHPRRAQPAGAPGAAEQAGELQHLHAPAVHRRAT